MNIRNLTPHPITINGETYLPEGIIPRTSEVREEPITLTGGLELNRIYVGAVQGLPEPSNCFLVVSREVAIAAHRPDVVAVCDYIRDDEGRIIGAKSIAWFPPPDISAEALLVDDNKN